MAMDYGNVSNGWSGMGGYAISASEGLRKQLVAAGMSDCKVGVTPMIGQNDVASEVFQLSDAKELSDWAKNKDWVRTLAFWSINRDNSKKGDLFISTKVDQKDFEFLTNLQEWSKGGKPIYTNPAPVLPDLTKIPDRIFAPYVDILTHPTFDINFASSKSGVSQFILGSMGSNQFGNPAWGDNLALDEQFYVDYIKKIRANGGDIMISFGGPETKELALGKKDPKELQKKYQWVIDQYALRWMDFNMQDDAINDLASIDVRSKALYGLTQKNVGLILQMTLPVTSNGLTDAGIKLLKNAVDNGLQFNGI
jgi:chitinase